jgi:hypothetical protein
MVTPSMPCSSKMMKCSGILGLEHSRRNQCSMIQNCTVTIALVIINRSGKTAGEPDCTRSVLREHNGRGERPFCWSRPSSPHNLLFDDREGFPVVVSMSTASSQPPPRPFRAGYCFREHGVKAARGVERSGWGALVLALTPCYTGDPAWEVRMEH